MGIRRAFVPLLIVEDLQSSGRDLRISFARYFEVPLDAWMSTWVDQRRWGWCIRFSHPSWPDRGVNPPEEQWDYGWEHGHLMDLGCDVPRSHFACEHAGERGVQDV